MSLLSKDEELNKYILRQHQCGAVERVVERALDPKRKRGLVWHTQGSGKTFTMIKAVDNRKGFLIRVSLV